MKFTEELSWILDKPGTSIHDQDEKYRQNIGFVHSLGLKCDCVGWSELDPASPRAEEILLAITRFCRENGWRARGMYTRRFAGESDWQEIRFSDARDGFFGDFREAPGEDGGTVRVCTVKAYQELSPAPKMRFLEYMLVPERFRSVCVEQGLTGVDFCWAQDKGKYDAAQYFHLYPCHAVQHMTESTFFHYYAPGMPEYDPRQAARMQELGGSLPRLAEVFSDLMISLPRCYLAAELPAGGFSSAYMPPESRFASGRQQILVHRDTAAALLKNKALQPFWLAPVPVLDAFLPGHEPVATMRQEAPAPAVREELLRAYERLKATERPVRMVTEKEALKLLRGAKKSRGSDFGKAMPKVKAALLAETPYAPLAPYYQIVGSGYISDEYELLPHARAVEATDGFRRSLEMEELLTDRPDGIVFAQCPDGDLVLLLTDGTVIRFSHEAPETVNTWPSLPQFVVDALNEE